MMFFVLLKFVYIS